MFAPRRFLFAALMVLSGASSAVAAEDGAPKVVASILPVHSLVAGVMEGVGTPTLLVPPGASPHGTSLKPSDAAALAGADLVVWVGPGLESFLPSVLTARAKQARLLELEDVEGVIRLEQRVGALWDHAHGEEAVPEARDDHDHGDEPVPEAHDHEHAHGHEADGYSENIDPHLWLDPRNTILWTQAIADALAGLDPAHADLYRRNAAARIAVLQALDTDVAAALAPVVDRPFLVFHDAYRYLEERYGLTAVGALALHPGQSPGARHLAEVRHRVEEAGVRCIFGEPQFSDRLARTVAEGTGVRVRTLDPLGQAEALGPDLYPAMMRSLVGELRDCLMAN